MCIPSSKIGKAIFWKGGGNADRFSKNKSKHKLSQVKNKTKIHTNNSLISNGIWKRKKWSTMNSNNKDRAFAYTSLLPRPYILLKSTSVYAHICIVYTHIPLINIILKPSVNVPSEPQTELGLGWNYENNIFLEYCEYAPQIAHRNFHLQIIDVILNWLTLRVSHRRYYVDNVSGRTTYYQAALLQQLFYS